MLVDNTTVQLSEEHRFDTLALLDGSFAEDAMTTADCLMLDAKQAILDEHHRRFQDLHREGKVEEAVQQIQVTLSCAADLLNDSLKLLDDTLNAHCPTVPPTNEG